MLLYSTALLGFIIFLVLTVFWWLIVLDLDNHKKLKNLTTSKNKPDKIKK